VYVFSREREAANALSKMRKSEIILPLLGKHPGGIHVMYLNAKTGTLEVLTDVSAVSASSPVPEGSPIP
jgi:hypothetical protein